LSSTDDARGLFPVLSTLSPSPTPARDEYAAHFQQLKRFPGSYFAIVIVDTSNDQVVGTGTVFMERKLIRNLGMSSLLVTRSILIRFTISGLVGHIEDIVVSPKMQGKKLGLRIINALTHISEHQGAYKTILNCSNENISTCFLRVYLLIFDTWVLAFYQKCGFKQKENEMASLSSLRAKLERTNLPTLGQIC
jgi:glucosamine-phosphate N-acetyltransferase